MSNLGTSGASNWKLLFFSKLVGAAYIQECSIVLRIALHNCLLFLQTPDKHPLTELTRNFLECVNGPHQQEKALDLTTLPLIHLSLCAQCQNTQCDLGPHMIYVFFLTFEAEFQRQQHLKDFESVSSDNNLAICCRDALLSDLTVNFCS